MKRRERRETPSLRESARPDRMLRVNELIKRELAAEAEVTCVLGTMDGIGMK